MPRLEASARSTRIDGSWSPRSSWLMYVSDKSDSRASSRWESWLNWRWALMNSPRRCRLSFHRDSGETIASRRYRPSVERLLEADGLQCAPVVFDEVRHHDEVV